VFAEYCEKHYCSPVINYAIVIALHPNNSQTFVTRGNTYMRIGEVLFWEIIGLAENIYEEDDEKGEEYITQAINDYTEAIRLDPEFVKAYEHRAGAYYLLHEFEKTIIDLTKVIEAINLDARFVKSYENRIYIYDVLEETVDIFDEYNIAIPDLTKIFQIDPYDAPDYYLARGISYNKLGDSENAIKDYIEAVRLDSHIVWKCETHECYTAATATLNPNDSKTYLIRGYAYYSIGEYQKSIDDFNNAIRLEPKLASAYRYRADAYHKFSKYDQAILDYTEAINLNRNNKDDCDNVSCYSAIIILDPDDAQAYYNRGNKYYEGEEFEKAVEDYSEAIQINPKYTSFYYCDNISCYTALINLYPDNAGAYFRRGDEYFGIRELEKAVEDYSEAVRIDQSFAVNCGNSECFSAVALILRPTDPATFQTRANAYYELHEYEKSIADYAESILLDPEFAKYCRNVLCFTAIINLDPNNAQAYYDRADAYYYGLEEVEKALADYSEAIRLEPEYAEDCIYAPCYTALINLNPNDSQAYYNRGNAYYKHQEYEKAIVDYSESIRLDSTNFKAYGSRGDAYYELGEFRSAVAEYTEAIRLDLKTVLYCNSKLCFNTFITINPNPRDAKTYYFRAIAYNHLNQHEKEIADFLEGIYLARKNSDTKMLLELQFRIQQIIENEARVGNLEQSLDLLSKLEQLQQPLKDGQTLNCIKRGKPNTLNGVSRTG
jgi:tetratricopeptide (TPR) repeat protein